MSWWTRRRGRERRAASAGSAASRGSCRRPSRTCRPRRPRRGRSFRWLSIPVPGSAKPHSAAQRAASPPHGGRAADLGAALHARVAADRHEAAVGRAGSPRQADVDERLTVSTPCACCVRPIDQTKIPFGRSTSKRANASSPRAQAALALDRVPRRPVGGPHRSKPVVCARRRRVHTACLDSALRTPFRNARSPRCAPRTSRPRWRPENALLATDGIQ